MSLTRALAKVAIAAALAKGVSSMNRKGSTGGLLGGTSGRDDLSRRLSGQNGSGGLGGLLEGLSGGASSGSRSTGGIDAMLGQVLGGGRGGTQVGGSTAGGGLAGALASVLGGAAAARASSPQAGTPDRSFSHQLNSAIARDGEPDAPSSPEQEAAAGLMLAAMVQAAKSDGEIDAAERAKLMEAMDDATPEERAFVEQQMNAPVDPEALAAEVPDGLGPQTYTMALMAIDLDRQSEADFLRRLARGLDLDAATLDRIHDEIGQPRLMH